MAKERSAHPILTRAQFLESARNPRSAILVLRDGEADPPAPWKHVDALDLDGGRLFVHRDRQARLKREIAEYS